MIFPEIDFEPSTDNPIKLQQNLKPLKEYAWDFDKGEFLLKDGRFQLVEGNEAVKVWTWKALSTSRYRYLAYSWDYGSELENLIGNGLTSELTKSEIERYIKEALLISPYIKSIDNFEITIDDSSIAAAFTLNTVYGEVIMNV